MNFDLETEVRKSYHSWGEQEELEVNSRLSNYYEGRFDAFTECLLLNKELEAKGQDREALVNKIKALIDKISQVGSWCGVSDGYYYAIDELKDLINDTKESK